MTILRTAAALVAFAANSILCRTALAGSTIDPVSFTAIRLGSGAAVLWWLARASGEPVEPRPRGGSWPSGLALFTYAIAFSLAYVSLSAGTGALILFGAVQLTMFAFAVRSGQRLRPAQWGGLLAALAGLVALVFPGLSAPDPLGALLMAVAGVAWGVYSIRGRGARAPVRRTAGNFACATVLALPCLLPAAASLRAEPAGVLLACASGGLASALGYVVWYGALRGLGVAQAAVVQLLVPVLAGVAGVLVLGEPLGVRLVAAGLLVLGGVAVVVWPRDASR